MEEQTPRKESRCNWILITVLIVLGVSIVVSLIGPPVIDELFDIPAPNWFLAVSWDKEEALGYFGDALSFLGTVILGAVAVFQTDRANKQTDIANAYAKKANDQTDRANQLTQDAIEQTKIANELAAQMQKLEQANYYSIVSVEALMVNKQIVSQPKYRNAAMPDPEILDMVSQDYLSCHHCYHVDVRFKNESKYPIVQMATHAYGRYDSPSVKYGIKDVCSDIYIAPEETCDIRFLIPTTAFEKYKEYKIVLSLSFVNVFDYASRANITIDDVSTPSSIKDYTYRLEKFSGLMPPGTIN